MVVAKNIDAIYRQFLWSSNDEKQIWALVAWDKLCNQKKYRGIGIRKRRILSKALRSKLVWRIVDNDQVEWVKICKSKYLEQSNSILRTRDIPSGSNFLNGIK